MNRLLSSMMTIKSSNNMNVCNIAKYMSNNIIQNSNSISQIRSFHNSNNLKGFEEFYDQKKPNEVVVR